MSNVLLPRIFSIYGRRTILATSQHRFLSVTCCRNQQAPKAKSEQADKQSKKEPKAKSTAEAAAAGAESSAKEPTPKPTSKPETPKTKENLVFKEGASPLSPPTAEGQIETFSPKITRLIDEIAGLTLLEVADLNKALKKKLNLPDAPMYAAAAMAAPASSSAKAEEEESAPAVAAAKTKFNVKLTKIDESKKIAIIKEIKAIVPNLNLVQAKKFVETLPQTVKGDILKDEAEKLSAQLTALGATCEID
jgi:large subunit ribosomal protein L7/L12